MLRITGGKVHDPANGLDGVVKDVCIAEGRIVPQIEGGRTIDASGLLVFPGGVDVHSHVAGAALNFARSIPADPDQRLENGSFGPIVELGPGVSGLDRFVALLGRSPDWR